MAWKVSPHWAHKIFIDFFSSHSFPRYISSPSTLLANNYYSPKGPAGDMPKKWRNSSRFLILFKHEKKSIQQKVCSSIAQIKAHEFVSSLYKAQECNMAHRRLFCRLLHPILALFFNVFWPWWRHRECKKHPWLRWCARDKAYKGHTVCGFWQWHFYHSWCW